MLGKKQNLYYISDALTKVNIKATNQGLTGLGPDAESTSIDPYLYMNRASLAAEGLLL